VTQPTERDDAEPADAELQGLGTIGRFEITGQLGRGGMGVVLAARDAELDRRVAIKVLYPGSAGDVDLATAREAQAMARLSHPNVVTVYEVGRLGGRAYIAMELVDGETLREWLAARPRPWPQVLAKLIAAGRGLAAAHEVGLVHRDFKPENVLIGGDGRPRVGDFGLATGDPAPGGVVAGTPAYMAPEQASGGPIDPRTDQYAFAVATWEALWGERPGAGQSTPPAQRRGVPRRVEAALRRGLAVDPAARWPSLAVLLDELERRARDRRPLAVGAITLLGLGAAVALSLRGEDAAASPCRGAGAELDGVWNPMRAETVAAAFAALPGDGAAAWRETATTIDRWAAGYRTVSIETCELERTRAEGVAAIAAARTACLDRRRTELDGMVATLETPDATIVPFARAAAHGLVRPEACLAIQLEGRDAAPPPAGPERLADAYRRIARAAALRALGKPREGLAIAEEVAADADRLDWAPLVAAAYLELGLARQANHDNDAGEAAHQRAAWYADVGHDDALRFAATLGLVRGGIDASRYDDAARQLETARMIARRLPSDPRRAAELAGWEASLAYWRGSYGDCVTRSERAIAAIEAASGPDAIDGAAIRMVMVRCLGKLGRHDERPAPLRRALAIADATVGRDHPLAADVLNLMGAAAQEAGRPEEALEHYAAALAVRVRVLGEDNPDVAAVHNNLGNALRDLGRYDEARASLERAVAIWEQAWGHDSPAVAAASSNLGEVAMKVEDYPAAEAHFRRALEIRVKKRPPGHEDIARAQVKLGRALLARGDRACRPLLEEAVADLEKNPDVDPAWREDARAQLAACRAR
jgi:tetratricopeptide (TPR) repeat protein